MNRLAPGRFLWFGAALLAATGIALVALPPRNALLIGFDLAAAGFLASLLPLLRESDADAMRVRARRNDANRTGLLLLSGALSLVVIATVASLVSEHGALTGAVVALSIATLVLAWTFANTVFALHYAHLFYQPDRPGGGIQVPGTDEPDYVDFLYFAFTLGMTFQTSDVQVTGRHVRGIVLLHTLAAFLFNIGVLAFVINLLGGSS